MPLFFLMIGTYVFAYALFGAHVAAAAWILDALLGRQDEARSLFMLSIRLIPLYVILGCAMGLGSWLQSDALALRRLRFIFELAVYRNPIAWLVWLVLEVASFAIRRVPRT